MKNPPAMDESQKITDSPKDVHLCISSTTELPDEKQQKIQNLKPSPLKSKIKGVNSNQLPSKPHFMHEKRKIKGQIKEQSSKDSLVMEKKEVETNEKQGEFEESQTVEEEKSVIKISHHSKDLVVKESKGQADKSTVLAQQKKDVETKKQVTLPMSPTSPKTTISSTKQSGPVTPNARPKKRTISNKPKRKILDVEKNDPKQSTITQHFQARRSERKTKKQVEKEARIAFEERILNNDESNLEIRLIEGKGRGVFSKTHLKRGDLVCEYAGDLISHDDARQREIEYAINPEVGCYMYYFVFDGKKYCVDATKESGRLGRLLNHSKTNSNVYTRLFPIKDKPYLILVASRDVRVEEELLYDYGDRSKTAIESHPWLKT